MTSLSSAPVFLLFFVTRSPYQQPPIANTEAKRGKRNVAPQPTRINTHMSHLEEEETTHYRPVAVPLARRRARGEEGAAGEGDDNGKGHDDGAEALEPPPQLPRGQSGYYACRTCRRILVEPQWVTDGCLGCHTGAVARAELSNYATPHFANFFGLIDPEHSWVARLIGKARPGVECPNAIYAERIEDQDEEDEEDGDDDDDGGDDGEGDSDDGDDATGPKRDRIEGDELLGF